MGGTRDYTAYVSKALISHKPYDLMQSDKISESKFNKWLIISFNHSFDFEEVKDDILTPFNRYTYLQSTGEFTDSESDVLFIGPDCSDTKLPEHFDFKSIDDIQDSLYDPIEELTIPIITKAAKYFYWLIREKRNDYSYIQVDFNIGMACINF